MPAGHLLLAALLVLAAISDLRTQKIPNALPLAGIVLGAALFAWRAGGAGMLCWLEGGGVALLTLLPYALGGLGAGDVKLFLAVGALMGPVFLLWTLLGSILAGGLLALGYVARGLVIGQSAVARRMPMAPAIALGAMAAYWRLHLGVAQ